MLSYCRSTRLSKYLKQQAEQESPAFCKKSQDVFLYMQYERGFSNNKAEQALPREACRVRQLLFYLELVWAYMVVGKDQLKGTILFRDSLESYQVLNLYLRVLSENQVRSEPKIIKFTPQALVSTDLFQKTPRNCSFYLNLVFLNKIKGL